MWCDQEFPDKYHGTADDHSCQGTVSVGTFPEQCKEHNSTESGTKSCPCEGYDTEDRTVRITGKEYTDGGNDQNSDTSHQHGLFFCTFDSEAVLQQIF